VKTSKRGITLIKDFEGCMLRAYDDFQPKVFLTPTTKIKGTLTIGYGHTGLVNGKKIAWDTKITRGKATLLLIEDLERFEKVVLKYDKKYHWSQNEFDALVSFSVNNGGIGQLTALGTRSRKTIAKKMLLYNKSKGKVLNGLIERRKIEQELFLS
jgi:lysozyme